MEDIVQLIKTGIMRIKMDQFEIFERSRINKTVILDLVKLDMVIKKGKK